MTAVEDEHPTSSTSTFSKEEVDKLMSQGKRHFVCDEIDEAVKCFEVACFMLSKEYGALSNECADAHYQYGKSSLELARLESGVLGSALNEAVEEEVDYSDDESSMDKDGQCGTSAGASAEGDTNNKLEKPDNEKADGSSGVKMDEDKTASNMEDKSTDNDKDNIMEEENTGTSEEKPANEKVGEKTEEKMVEDKNKMNDNKISDNKSDDNKDSINQEKQENKDISGDTNMSNKESTSEEQKEVDESKEIVAANDQSKKEGQKEDTEEQKDGTEGRKEGTEGPKEGTDGQKEGTDGQKEATDGQKEATEGQKEGTEGQKKDTEEPKEGTEGQKGESTTTGKQNGTDDNKDIADVKDDKTTDDGAISTIQLAWESLELARIIFMRHNNREMQLKLAQTHSLLGEIHMEQEQFSDAVSELQKCLNIQKNLLKPDDRVLAETYYHLGLAYTLSMLYEESANHYCNATEVLELRLKNINARIEEAEQQDKGKSKASDDDPLVKDRKELTELEELLPEIKEKCLEAKNEGERLKSNIKNELGLTSLFGDAGNGSTCSSSCSGDTAKPVNDISHLVRKQKRKTKEEESTENSEAPAKKPRQDDDSTTTQAENGDSVMAEAADVEKLS